MTLHIEPVKIENTTTIHLYRARVPNGWLVFTTPPDGSVTSASPSVAYYPDPEYKWDASAGAGYGGDPEFA